MTDDKPKAPLLYGPDGRPIEQRKPITVPGLGRTPVPLSERPHDDLHRPEAYPDDRPGDTEPAPPPPHIAPGIPNVDYLEPPDEAEFQVPKPGENLILIAGGFHGHPIPVTVDRGDAAKRELRVRYIGPHRIDMKVLAYDTDLLWGRVVWTIKGRTKSRLKLRLKGIVDKADVPPPPEGSS